MSSEVEDVRVGLQDVQADVRDLRQVVTMLNEDLPLRVATLENRVGTVESRMNRIDSMLLELVKDVRSVQRALSGMQTDSAMRLDELRTMMLRILDANQPKATL